MGYYKLLSEPYSEYIECNYKGLYRVEPFYVSDYTNKELELFNWYINKFGDSLGVSTQEDLPKLLEFQFLLKRRGFSYDLIYYNKIYIEKNGLVFFGCDVAYEGHYSPHGDGFLLPKYVEMRENKLSNIQNKQNFDLNSDYLFENESDAKRFIDYLNQINRLYEGYIENWNWEVYFIYGVEVVLPSKI